MKKISYLFFFALFFSACGESLEDTYKDYAGDAIIRYLGKCTDFTVTPGWKRVRLEWTNGVDEMVDKIKVSWSASDVTHDTLLPRETTQLELINLGDATYRFDVCSVDANGGESLKETNYGRPYTENHEVIRTFTRGITKFYKLNGFLVYFLDKWNDNIEEITLHYTNLQGKNIVRPLTEEDFIFNFGILDNIDTSLPISIYRVGKVEGCPDLITFDPIVLGDERTFTSDFKLAILRRYGISDTNKEEFDNFIDNVTNLEIDYNIGSLEDVLYCPKLQKLVLGKNRFLNLDYPVTLPSIMYDEERSCNVLSAAQMLTDLSIDRYNNHFSSDLYADYGIYCRTKQPALPNDLTYLPASAIDTITNTIAEITGYDSGLRNLIDGDITTYWEPLESGSIRKYEIIITLDQPYKLKGFRVVQCNSSDQKSQKYAPGEIELQVSNNRIEWERVSYVDKIILGRCPGESTLIYMVEPKEVRYVKMKVSDLTNVSVCNIKLADIIPFY